MGKIVPKTHLGAIFRPFFPFLGHFSPMFAVRPTSMFRRFFSYFGAHARADFLPGGHARNPKTKRKVPSQKDKYMQISFVLRPDLGVQCTHTYVNNSEHHQCELDAHTSPSLRNYLAIDASTHTHTSACSWLTNSNSTRIHACQEKREFKMYAFPLGWHQNF